MAPHAHAQTLVHASVNTRALRTARALVKKRAHEVSFASSFCKTSSWKTKLRSLQVKKDGVGRISTRVLFVCLDIRVGLQRAVRYGRKAGCRRHAGVVIYGSAEKRWDAAFSLFPFRFPFLCPAARVSSTVSFPSRA